MTNETKLLTEADARRLAYSPNPASTLAELRERGLIAPEPVDPLREIAEDLWHISVGPKGEAVTRMTAELRSSGVTLTKPELTREMVRGAVVNSLTVCDMLEQNDFDLHETCGDRRQAEGFVTRLHAALTEGQSK